MAEPTFKMLCVKGTYFRLVVLSLFVWQHTEIQFGVSEYTISYVIIQLFYVYMHTLCLHYSSNVSVFFVCFCFLFLFKLI
jgi:hypothetical protein